MKLWKIDQYWEFTVQTQAFATGAATDADALPAWRVYECALDGTANDTVVASGEATKRDDSNTVGYYACRGQITTAAGFEVGKTYEVRVSATVASVAGADVVGRFGVLPALVWDSLIGGTDYLQSDAVQVNGAGQTAADVGSLVATALSSAVWTGTRAAKLDNLDTTVGSRSTYAGGDTAGVTTLLTRVTGAVALEATLTALKGVGWSTETLKALYDAVALRLLASAYTAPDNTNAAKAGVLADKLTTAIELDGAVYRFTANALEEAPVGGGGGGGTGARTVTVTVTDGTDPMESVSVRLTKSGDTYILATGANGQAVFSLDDGAYALAASYPRWTMTPSTVTVNGDESVAVTMAPVSPSVPSNPNTCNCYAYTRDIHGSPVVGVSVVFVLYHAGGAGSIYDGSEETVVSGPGGLVEMELPYSSMAAMRLGKGQWKSFTVPAELDYELPDVVVA